MGKFDGFLICSDLDGTFVGKDDVVEVNCKAVKYFTDNGGKFSFVTGRTASYLPEQACFGVMNAPAGVFNGGTVFDYENNKILTEVRLDFKLRDFAKEVMEWTDDIVCFGLYNSCLDPSDRVESFEDSADRMDCNLIKIVCVFETSEKADAFKEYVTGRELFKNTYISKSWAEGVEFNSKKGTKGDAIKFIKECLGDIHTSIGIGDFGNDVKLLEGADIGVAVGNAVDELKAIADFVVKPCSEYAIKDLIEIIESRL